MKRFRWAFPALVSVLLVAMSLVLVARPRYGGTLRVEMSATIATLDPAVPTPDLQAQEGRSALLPLVFETLTAVDAAGQPQPRLAASWQSDAQGRRWQFRLRTGVQLHDGSLLTTAQVAAALRHVADASWKITEVPGGLTVECDQPTPTLPWQLGALRYAIALAGPAGVPMGTGPFRIDRFEPNRRVTLAAYDDYWGGRPFLDSVVVEMGRPGREQATSLELGRADIIGVLPQDARRLSQRGVRLARSRPRELVALVIDANTAFGANDQARSAVAAAIDRLSIANVLLQREAEPARSLLPDWLSGYATGFRLRYDRTAARAIATALPPQFRTPALEYTAGDPLAQAVAERIAVDLRDSGLTPRIAAAGSRGVPAPRADLRLVRFVLDAEPADRALTHLISTAGLGSPMETEARDLASAEDAYRLERAFVDRNVLVPIVHLPALYALSARVRVPAGVLVAPSGALGLADTWLEPDRSTPVNDGTGAQPRGQR